MKRIFMFAVAMTFAVACAKSEETTDTTADTVAAEPAKKEEVKKELTADERKALSTQFFDEVWTKKNLDFADKHVAATFVSHDPANPEPVKGVDGYKANVKKYQAAFSDAKMTADEVLVDGNFTMSRWTATGTNDGELNGMPATNKKSVISGIGITKFDGDKAVEAWGNWDTMGMMVQLGVVPMPKMPKAKKKAKAPKDPVYGKAPTREEAVKVINDFAAAVEKCDVKAMMALHADDYVHRTARPGMDPTKKGAEKEIAGWCKAFTDIKFKVEATHFADGVLVARVNWGGKHTGKHAMLPPPTNKTVSVSGTDWIKISDGKFKERWGYGDEMGMMAQLGMLPPPPGAKTAKK